MMYSDKLCMYISPVIYSDLFSTFVFGLQCSCSTNTDALQNGLLYCAHILDQHIAPSSKQARTSESAQNLKKR